MAKHSSAVLHLGEEVGSNGSLVKLAYVQHDRCRVDLLKNWNDGNQYVRLTRTDVERILAAMDELEEAPGE